jgi:hypothetical protein
MPRAADRTVLAVSGILTMARANMTAKAPRLIIDTKTMAKIRAGNAEIESIRRCTTKSKVPPA